MNRIISIVVAVATSLALLTAGSCSNPKGTVVDKGTSVPQCKNKPNTYFLIIQPEGTVDTPTEQHRRSVCVDVEDYNGYAKGDPYP